MSAPASEQAAVTAVIPTRDRVHLLTDTLRSILAQREVEVEVVIVDDGSSDRHAQAIEDLGRGRVTVVRNPTARGVATARNQGGARARTPWVAFCDDDDLWAPAKLATQLAALTRTGRRWAYTGAVKFEAGPMVWQVMDPPTAEQVARRLPERNLIPAGASNVLVDRDTFSDVGGFDEGLGHLADWDLWLRLLEGGPPACAPGIGVAYRLHTGAMSLNPAGILTELRVIDTRWRHLRSGRALDPGPTHLWIAMSWLRAGRRVPAAGSYLRAMRHQPRSGLRGLVRTMYPLRPTPAHVVEPARSRLPRLKRVEHVELPREMHELLAAFAGSDAPAPVSR